jgi:hypothetical protein
LQVTDIPKNAAGQASLGLADGYRRNSHYRVRVFVGEARKTRNALLGAFAFSDVMRDAKGSDDVPLLITQGHLGRQNPRVRTIWPRLFFFCVQNGLTGADYAALKLTLSPL